MGLNVTLVLLPHDQPWNRELPVRLRELYSHWWCSEEEVVVLRPIPFRQRQAHFVLAVDDQLDVIDGRPAGVECLQIESHLRGKPWTELLDQVGRCSLTVSEPVLKAPTSMLSALEATISQIAFNVCSQFKPAPLQHGAGAGDGAPALAAGAARLPRQGRAVQVDPMKRMLKAPGTFVLKP